MDSYLDAFVCVVFFFNHCGYLVLVIVDWVLTGGLQPVEVNLCLFFFCRLLLLPPSFRSNKVDLLWGSEIFVVSSGRGFPFVSFQWVQLYDLYKLDYVRRNSVFQFKIDKREIIGESQTFPCQYCIVALQSWQYLPGLTREDRLERSRHDLGI